MGASKLQRDVVASLLALELAPQEEVRTPQGYSLDAVVMHGGREVAIEVDGPWHFCGRTPTGATALKRRQLRAAGWALLPVPYWEWRALGSNKKAEQKYLRAALGGACSELIAIICPLTSRTLSRAQSGTSAPAGLRVSATAFTPSAMVHKLALA